jgi:hypothetical protein
MLVWNKYSTALHKAHTKNSYWTPKIAREIYSIEEIIEYFPLIIAPLSYTWHQLAMVNDPFSTKSYIQKNNGR